MLALSCVGSAIGVSMGGNATIAAIKKNPDIFGKSLVLCALPSTQGLYGFAGFFLMLSSLREIDGMINLNQGLALFAAGVALGIVGLYSGIQQASLVANGVNEMSNGKRCFREHYDSGGFPRTLRDPGVCRLFPRSSLTEATKELYRA